MGVFPISTETNPRSHWVKRTRHIEADLVFLYAKSAIQFRAALGAAPLLADQCCFNPVFKPVKPVVRAGCHCHANLSTPGQHANLKMESSSMNALFFQ
jgi:hypothetical protein